MKTTYQNKQQVSEDKDDGQTIEVWAYEHEVNEISLATIKPEFQQAVQLRIPLKLYRKLSVGRHMGMEAEIELRGLVMKSRMSNGSG